MGFERFDLKCLIRKGGKCVCLIGVVLLVCILGCAGQRRGDPYLAAVTSYRAGLVDWDYHSDGKPMPPPKPAFLPMSSHWSRSHIPLGYSGSTARGVVMNWPYEFDGHDVFYGETLYSSSETNRINDERRRAHNSALSEYKSALKRYRREQEIMSQSDPSIYLSSQCETCP